MAVRKVEFEVSIDGLEQLRCFAFVREKDIATFSIGFGGHKEAWRHKFTSTPEFIAYVLEVCADAKESKRGYVEFGLKGD